MFRFKKLVHDIRIIAYFVLKNCIAISGPHIVLLLDWDINSYLILNELDICMFQEMFKT